MNFFFPDSQDLISPSFDFGDETHAEFRIRQRDDLYAHEVFEEPPFDGVLVSKAIVDGISRSTTGRYSLAQRHRLSRVGIRAFLRLDQRPGSSRLKTLGDCGAFTYKDEEEPPFSAEDVVAFYDECRFDMGISVDHVILEYRPEWDAALPGFGGVPAEVKQRQELTIDLAREFHELHRTQGCGFEPLGVAQGWSPSSYADAVERLQQIGYDYIAIGGMVPLRTPDILACLEAVDAVRRPETRFHLLGVTRCEQVGRFQNYGVASFDSTSPFLQAFKDDRDNYHTLERTFTAVRVPQVEGNAKLQRRIRAGRVDQKVARELEQGCLTALRAYDRDECSLDEVVALLRAYEQVHDDRKDRSQSYRETLEARPWKRCPCDVCQDVGVDVVIFRGSERNKRRGFHNLSVFNRRLRRELDSAAVLVSAGLTKHGLAFAAEPND